MSTLITLIGPDKDPITINGKPTCGNGHAWKPQTTRWRFRDRMNRKGHESYGWERDCLVCKSVSQGRGGSGLRTQTWLAGATK